MVDFSVYNSKGVEAAKELVENGLFSENSPKDYTIDFISNELAKIIER